MNAYLTPAATAAIKAANAAHIAANNQRRLEREYARMAEKVMERGRIDADRRLSVLMGIAA